MDCLLQFIFPVKRSKETLAKKLARFLNDLVILYSIDPKAHLEIDLGLPVIFGWHLDHAIHTFLLPPR